MATATHMTLTPKQLLAQTDLMLSYMYNSVCTRRSMAHPKCYLARQPDFSDYIHCVPGRWSARLLLCQIATLVPLPPINLLKPINAESSRYIMLANLCVNTLSIEGPYGFEKSAYGFEKCEGYLDYLLKSKLPNVIRICKIGMHPFPWGSLNLWKQISITTATVVFLVV